MSAACESLDHTRRNDIATALKALLEGKSLYQHVQIISTLDAQRTHVLGVIEQNLRRQGGFDSYRFREFETGFSTYIAELQRVPWKFVTSYHKESKMVWEVDSGAKTKKEKFPPPTPDSLSVDVPIILIPCSSCSSILPPHHGGFDGASPLTLWATKDRTIFWLPYICKACHADPLVFTVVRDGERLTLVGRSEFPSVDVPKSLPKNGAGLFRRALIALSTGFTLAALSYLRAFVEKYMRSVTNTDPEERLTGDELGDKYAAFLTERFAGGASSLPSLKVIYNDLSAKLHRGEEDEEAVATTNSCAHLVRKHFALLEALQL